MKDVIRITIRGFSGCVPYEETYEDKVTISADTIRYELKPMVQTPVNMASKWSYKTTSSTFNQLFRETVSAVEKILNRCEDDFVDDIGMTSFTVQYSDKTKKNREFFLPSEDFKECFAIVKQMVPSCEEIPAVLRTSEDL